MEQELTERPQYYKCANEAEFNALNEAAAQVLGTDIYQQPLIDINGDFWFIVNVEIEHLVDFSLCKLFSEINF
jgi:hypothetical protein